MQLKHEPLTFFISYSKNIKEEAVFTKREINNELIF